MAIVLNEGEKKLNWFPVAVGGFSLAFVGVAVYFLFLASTPFIEKIVPVGTEPVVGLIEIADNDPTLLLNDPVFLSLKQYIPNPDVGTLGKADPFLTF